MKEDLELNTTCTHVNEALERNNTAVLNYICNVIRKCFCSV